jgi:hypothetical protein
MVSWEAMALASYFLVTTDHGTLEIRRAITGFRADERRDCRRFALEESGNYLAAEPSGRRAIELDH